MLSLVQQVHEVARGGAVVVRGKEERLGRILGERLFELKARVDVWVWRVVVRYTRDGSGGVEGGGEGREGLL